MKTIITNIYNIYELSEEAKEKAIEEVRDDYYSIMSECNWDDAFETLKKVFEITGLKANISESSQGFYCRSYDYDYNTYSECGWDNLVENIRQMPIDFWCDYDIIRAFADHEYNKNRTFEANIISAYLDFCSRIDRQNIELFDDNEGILDYAESNEIEFLENGKKYIA